MSINLILFALCLVLLASFPSKTFGQKQPPIIDLGDLSAYVNNWDKRQDGERIVVNVGATIGSIQYQKSNRLYSFQAGENTDVGSTFFTSPALAKSLKARLNRHSEGSVTVYCTLVQFVGDQDVYRSPFVTKVEGWDGHGRPVWTVTGPPPLKLKMPQ